VCQYIAADPVDTRIVDAFFQALAPVELDVYAQVLAKRQQQAERLATAHAQHLERLRYEAAYCERQFYHVDPAHRHVAAELEHAWELALQALKQAEAAEQQRAQASTPPASALPPALQAAFRAIGQKLPELWSRDVLSQAQRKAFLRCRRRGDVSRRGLLDLEEVEENSLFDCRGPQGHRMASALNPSA